MADGVKKNPYDGGGQYLPTQSIALQILPSWNESAACAYRQMLPGSKCMAAKFAYGQGLPGLACGEPAGWLVSWQGCQSAGALAGWQGAARWHMVIGWLASPSPGCAVQLCFHFTQIYFLFIFCKFHVGHGVSNLLYKCKL